jgi:hypothetical protein
MAAKAAKSAKVGAISFKFSNISKFAVQIAPDGHCALELRSCHVDPAVDV